MPDTITHHVLCGWRVASELPLPEIPAWTGAPSHPIDVTVTAAPIEHVEEDGDAYLHIRSDGSTLLRIPGLVRILTRNGSEVVVDIERDDIVESWRLFLLGTALCHLCFQRGCLPLHAAALRIGGRTIAIAGHTGDGKSTLAAVLNRRGHPLLSDDITVVDVRADSNMMLPTFPRLRLWRDTLDELSIERGDLLPVREGLDKYTLDGGAGFDPSPVPLDAIVVLRNAERLALSPVTPAQAVVLLQARVQRRKLAERLGRKAALFGQVAAMVGMVPVLTLDRPLQFEALDATADLVEEAAAA